MGDLGLEQMLSVPTVTEDRLVVVAAMPATMPSEGFVVSAHQLVQVFLACLLTSSVVPDRLPINR